MWTHKRTTALSVRLLNTKLSRLYSRCHTRNVVFDIASKNMDWWQRTNNPAKWKGGKSHTCNIVTTFYLKTFDNKYKSIQLTLRAIITLVHVVDHMFWSLDFRAAFSLTRQSNHRHAPWHVNIILAACKSNEMICANVCMLRDTGQPTTFTTGMGQTSTSLFFRVSTIATPIYLLYWNALPPFFLAIWTCESPLLLGEVWPACVHVPSITCLRVRARLGRIKMLLRSQPWCQDHQELRVHLQSHPRRCP